MRRATTPPLAEGPKAMPIPRLPAPEVYEREYSYFAWGALLRGAGEHVARDAPTGSTVIDYMCGTGYLLRSLSSCRPDLRLHGCSLEPLSYVHFGRNRCPAADISYQDALEYLPPGTPDVVICTGGLHHLPRAVQPRFVAKVASELSPAGLFVVGEELIGAYSTETERRRRALEMNALLLGGLIDRGAPPDVLAAACDLLSNDLLERGEYKMSMDDLAALLAPHFTIVTVESFWSAGPAVGDVLVLARRK
jgi:Methyltransferase domain